MSSYSYTSAPARQRVARRRRAVDWSDLFVSLAGLITVAVWLGACLSVAVALLAGGGL